MMTTGSPTREARERLERLGLSGSVNEAALLTRIEELQEIVAAHEKDKAEFQRDKEELKQDKNELRDSNKDLRDAIASLRVENKELRDTNTGLRSDVEELTQKLETAKTQSDLESFHSCIPEGIELDDDGDPMDDGSLAAASVGNISLNPGDGGAWLIETVKIRGTPPTAEELRVFLQVKSMNKLLAMSGKKHRLLLATLRNSFECFSRSTCAVSSCNKKNLRLLARLLFPGATIPAEYLW